MPPFVHARALASGRPHSEDRAEVERGEDLVVVVADGAGGLRGGAAASDALVEAVRGAVHNGSFEVNDLARWVGIFTDVDAHLSAKMVGETTGVVVVLSAAGIVGVSAGDSEAWIVGPTTLDDLTGEQSKVRLGSGRARPVMFERHRLEGVLVVGTDGLFKYAVPERIVAAARGGSPSEAAEHLVRLVGLASGAYQDDVSLVVVGRAK
jgi:serine/threonine protein phosphatase PrpC